MTKPPILSDDEVVAIVEAALTTGPKTEAELESVLEWAKTARINALLLADVLDGHMVVDWNGSDVLFSLREEVMAGV